LFLLFVLSLVSYKRNSFRKECGWFE